MSPAAWCHPDLHVWSPHTWTTCLWKMLPSASHSTDGRRACPTVTQGRDSAVRSSLTLWSRPAAASDPPAPPNTWAWAGPGGGKGGFLYELSTPGGTPELLDEMIKCPRCFSPRSVLLEQGRGCGDWGSQADAHTWAPGHMLRMTQETAAGEDESQCHQGSCVGLSLSQRHTGASVPLMRLLPADAPHGLMGRWAQHGLMQGQVLPGAQPCACSAVPRLVVLGCPDDFLPTAPSCPVSKQGHRMAPEGRQDPPFC